MKCHWVYQPQSRADPMLANTKQILILCVHFWFCFGIFGLVFV